MARFKVKKVQGGVLFESDHLEEIYNFLKPQHDKIVIKNYIYDHVDDTNVHEDDFMEAWEAGERPLDLSMF